MALRPISQASQTSSDEQIISQEELPARKRIRMEDTSPEPITFHTKADLLWKLQRADFLPGLKTAGDMPFQGKYENRENVKIKRKSTSSKGSLMDGMESWVSEEGDLEPHQKNCKFSSVAEDSGLNPYHEDPFYPPGKPALSPPAKARASLLHEPPGLVSPGSRGCPASMTSPSSRKENSCNLSNKPVAQASGADPSR